MGDAPIAALNAELRGLPAFKAGNHATAHNERAASSLIARGAGMFSNAKVRGGSDSDRPA